MSAIVNQHRKLANDQADQARELRSLTLRINSQMAAIRSVTRAIADVERSTSGLGNKLVALQEELATMRLAILEIRRTQHEKKPLMMGRSRAS